MLSIMFTKQSITFLAIGTIHWTIHRCDACNKIFDTLNETADHIMSSHSPIEECPKCENIMDYRDFYVRSKHWMIYKCDDCGYLGDSWKVL